jgi:SAM-dependent methyltransferase
VTADERSVQAHYRTAGLLDRILAGLREAGKDPAAPTVDDLAPADEFHSLGRVATKDLAELAAFKPGSRLLDVGSGLGGPARFLAVTYGCDVTGVDLMPEFCAVATELSRRTGLGERTQFQHGNALALPFDDGTFDGVWTIQAQMNIADKRRFYEEIARVLRAGGRFAFQDICRGDGRPLEFPVPWASEAGQSHLITPGTSKRCCARSASWSTCFVMSLPLSWPGRTPTDRQQVRRRPSACTSCSATDMPRSVPTRAVPCATGGSRTCRACSLSPRETG